GTDRTGTDRTGTASPTAPTGMAPTGTGRTGTGPGNSAPDHVTTAGGAANPESLPRAVGVFTAALALAGAALGAASVVLFGAGDPRWWLAGPFTALLVAAGYLIIRFQYRDEVEALDLFEAVLAPVLFAFPGYLVVALVAAAKVL